MIPGEGQMEKYLFVYNNKYMFYSIIAKIKPYWKKQEIQLLKN
jgi:hypothetical protein